jgi:hypothetical protein
MPPITDRTAYWDHYATRVADDRDTTPEQALKDAFGWTQYDGHGPGEELLGEPASALELGRGPAPAGCSSRC